MKIVHLAVEVINLEHNLVVLIAKTVEIAVQGLVQGNPVVLVLVKLVVDKVIQVEVAAQQAALKMELKRNQKKAQ